MTRTVDALAALAPLINDLAHDLSPDLRYQRLLDTLRSLLPCDAVALLRLEGDVLVPAAVQGLSTDTLGRRFRVTDHPRLQAILAAPRAIQFAADCGLPDPYDGLVEAEGTDLAVHDCMGCMLRVNETTWGVLTLDAVEAGRFTASDLKILDTFASLAAATVSAAARMNTLTQTVKDERRKAEAYRLAAHPLKHSLTGRSPAFRQLTSEIELVAPSDLTVLITGETGVGKELVARAIHTQSSRATKILVSVNCAALPDNLVESELFGHVRGAFSGAVNDRLGKFEMAHGGTLFLDEVGELPLAAQAKLLRVLQDGQLQRVGSDREHHADIRLIAATNRDLAEKVRSGEFRADLYHRLSVFPLNVPPLRARGKDVLLLAGTFIEENRRRMGLRGLRLSAAAQSALVSYAWPGNVRELEYLIARAALKATGRSQHESTAATRAGIISVDLQDLDVSNAGASNAGALSALSFGVSGGSNMYDAPDMLDAANVARQQGLEGSRQYTEAHSARRNVNSVPGRGRQVDLREEVDAFQRRVIEATLSQHNGNLAASARALGMDRANLARLATRLGIDTAAKKERTPR